MSFSGQNSTGVPCWWMWWVLSAGNRRALTCVGLGSHLTRRLGLLAKHLLFILDGIIKDLERFFPRLYLFAWLFLFLSLDFRRFSILFREDENRLALFAMSSCGLHSRVGLDFLSFSGRRNNTVVWQDTTNEDSQREAGCRLWSDDGVLYTLLLLLASFWQDDQMKSSVILVRVSDLRPS